MVERAAYFRTYDRGWNRTGWSGAPQYPGQAGAVEDLPLRCDCGGVFVATGTGGGRCAAGHFVAIRPVAEMVGADG